MTGIMIEREAGATLPAFFLGEGGFDASGHRVRRRQRVKSVDEYCRNRKVNPSLLAAENGLPFADKQVATSYSVGNLAALSRTGRDRRSTDVSTVEECLYEASLSSEKDGDSGAFSHDNSETSGQESADVLSELKSFDSDSLVGAGGVQSEESSSRLRFPRKSSYIAKSKHTAVGGLAKLLKREDSGREQDLAKEEKVDMDMFPSFDEERHFGFRNCIHCTQIYACERAIDQAHTGVLEDYKRDKYCSGECHLTHLSSLYEKQRKRQVAG